MLQALFTNQLALKCTQTAATTMLALLVMLIVRTRAIHLERETIVALLRVGPHALGKQGGEPCNQVHQSDRHGQHSLPLLAQEWEAAYKPVALLSKHSPMDKVQIRIYDFSISSGPRLAAKPETDTCITASPAFFFKPTTSAQ